MEEFLLDPLLVLEELHVVDEQQVIGAVALLEALDPFVAQRVDEVVHERLAGDVFDREVARVLGDVLGDRLHQVGLAETGAAVDEERVVRLRRRFCDRECRRMGETVRGADHEQVEDVLRIEPRLRAAWRHRDLHLGRLGGPGLEHSQLHAALVPGRVAHGCLDQPEEVTLDPLAGEVVGDAEDEVVVRELLTVNVREPRPVCGFVERLLESTGNLGPGALRRQLDLGFQCRELLLGRDGGSERQYQPSGTVTTRAPLEEKKPVCRPFAASTQLSTAVECCSFSRVLQALRAVENRRAATLVYTARSPRKGRVFCLRWPCEADVSAQRASSEAQARLPRTHVHARGSHDPQASARTWTQAPLRVATCTAGIASRARGTSTPSTGTAVRSRRASSSSTGSRATPGTRSRGWESRCRSNSAARSSGIA